MEPGWLRPRFGRRTEGAADGSTGVLPEGPPGLLVMCHISHNLFLIDSVYSFDAPIRRYWTGRYFALDMTIL
jgi:hypothetical protein